MRKELFLSLLALCVFFAGHSQGTVVNVDFDARYVGAAGDTDSRSGTLFSGQGAYVDSGNDVWNSLYRNKRTGTELLASDGSVTPVAVTISGGDGYEDTAKANYLLSDYFYNATVTTITGLEASSDYVIYVYACGDQQGQGSNVTINDVTLSTTGEDVEDYIIGGNYVVFETASDATGQIVINSDSKINGLQIVSASAGKAQHPSPGNGDLTVDKNLQTTLSWQAYDVNEDPNLLTADVFDVYFYGVTDAQIAADPNLADPEQFDSFASKIYSGSDISIPVTLDFSTNYYWRVDTHVTWNASGFDPIITGSQWSFKTLDEYIAPTVSMDNVITTLDLGSADIAAVVSNNSDPITSIEFSVMSDAENYPGGAVLTNTTQDNQVPTARLNFSAAGTYYVQLILSDGISAPIVKVAEVVVYADACEAKKASPNGWQANYYDQDNDCDVDLADFAAFATNWLNDTSMAAQEQYAGSILYIPADRIEAESCGDNVSDAPLGPGYVNPDTGVEDPNQYYGIRKTYDGKDPEGTDALLGYTGAGAFAEYTIDVPAAGTYTIDLGVAWNNGNGTLELGIEGDTTAYGIVPVNGTGNWGNVKTFTGQVTFTTAGTIPFRITWGENTNCNLDWFDIDF